MDVYGSQHWFNKRMQYHRGNDRPAIIRADGSSEWIVNGLRHRDNNKLAVLSANGVHEWWSHGVCLGRFTFPGFDKTSLRFCFVKAMY